MPTPASFFGFEIGQELVRYDKVGEYFRVLAEKSERCSFQVIGRTHEQRDYVILTISAPDNLNRLEQIRLDHLQLTDPSRHVSRYDDKRSLSRWATMCMEVNWQVPMPPYWQPTTSAPAKMPPCSNNSRRLSSSFHRTVPES